MRLWQGIIAGIITFAISQLAQGQHAKRPYRPFTREISVISDNDNYLLQKRDGYYTNGLYLSLQHLVPAKKAGTQKVIMRYELGQMIFNPYKYSVTDPEQMDRPFAGYLYFKASRSHFFEKRNILQYGISAGVAGPASGGEQAQRAYHNLINIYEVRGWGYQLKNEPGVNLHAQYYHPLSAPPKPGQIADLHAVAKATLGNTFTNATAGLLFRIGLIEKNSQSVAWNSRLHSSTPDYLRRGELFVFFQPEVMLQGYNATIQGGLFRKDKGPVIGTPEPVLYQQRVGIMYARGRFSVVLADVHRSKEAKQMRRKENYGSIQLSYRMK